MLKPDWVLWTFLSDYRAIFVDPRDAGGITTGCSLCNQWQAGAELSAQCSQDVNQMRKSSFSALLVSPTRLRLRAQRSVAGAAVRNIGGNHSVAYWTVHWLLGPTWAGLNWSELRRTKSVCWGNSDFRQTFMLMSYNRDINQKLFPILSIAETSDDFYKMFVEESQGFSFVAYHNNMLVMWSWPNCHDKIAIFKLQSLLRLELYAVSWPRIMVSTFVWLGLSADTGGM